MGSLGGRRRTGAFIVMMWPAHHLNPCGPLSSVMEWYVTCNLHSSQVFMPQVTHGRLSMSGSFISLPHDNCTCHSPSLAGLCVSLRCRTPKPGHSTFVRRLVRLAALEKSKFEYTVCEVWANRRTSWGRRCSTRLERIVYWVVAYKNGLSKLLVLGSCQAWSWVALLSRRGILDFFLGF